MTRQAPRVHRRSGATAVETAIVLGAALMFMLAIFEYGRFVMIGQVMQNAAREGARYAVVHTGDIPPPNVSAYVQNYMAGQDVKLTGYSCNVFQTDITQADHTVVGTYNLTQTSNGSGQWYDAQFGQGIAVQINATYKPVVIGLLVDATHSMGVKFMSSSVQMQATSSVMLSEAN
jgi:Flp pilus assembly protein TadG